MCYSQLMSNFEWAQEKFEDTKGTIKQTIKQTIQ